MKIKKQIEASLLAFDRNNIQSQLESLKKAGISLIHYDVMDGKFVPNISFGTEFLQQIIDNDMIVNIHFMVNNPRKWIKRFMKYQVNLITFHPESLSKKQVFKTIIWMHKHHLNAGLAFKPTTDLTQYKDLICMCQVVTILGVQPGAGGQKFISQSLTNLKKVYEIKQFYNLNLVIQFDGGVNFDVIQKIAPYVDHFISGSFLMNYPKDKKEIYDFVNKYNN